MKYNFILFILKYFYTYIIHIVTSFRSIKRLNNLNKITYYLLLNREKIYST